MQKYLARPHAENLPIVSWNKCLKYHMKPRAEKVLKWEHKYWMLLIFQAHECWTSHIFMCMYSQNVCAHTQI